MQPFGKPYDDSPSGASQTGAVDIFQSLLETCEACPEKTAIVHVEGERRLTYKELYEQVAAFATGLSKLGLRQGDKIVACLPNWPAFVVALYAAARAGLVFIPANPRLRQHEIDFIVRNSGARAAVVADQTGDISHYEIFAACQGEGSQLQHIVAVTPNGVVSNRPLTFESVLALGRSQPTAPPSAVSADDVAAIVYTSGTTGTPKGAMLTHRNLFFSADGMNAALENSERDVILVVVPVCHIMGLSVSLMSVRTRSTMVLMEKFQAEAVFQVIEREKVTVHHGVSTMFVLELNHPNRSRYDLSSLRTGIIAATPCPYEVVERIRKELGLSPILSYGMTECSPALTATHFENEPWVYATVGRPLPGVSLCVVDENGKRLGPGEIGELLAKSPGLMKGYYNNEEATRQAIDGDGWFHTGDLAVINEFGYVSIVGRIKEMINRGGLKIYPREVEDLLYQLPAVQEAAVVGVPDPVLGERSCACVTVKPGHTLDPQEVVAFCRERLADYKVPDFVEIMDSLPLNSSGKIYKLELARMMKEKHPPTYRAN
ncbi:MAG: acyl--CoA ligase [Alicyclobacillaceae bacterium]|nr:acyl--CoA ligase [Alicyclobacillaceae bacterium]